MVAKLIQYENEYQFNEKKKKNHEKVLQKVTSMIAFNKSKTEDLTLYV